MWGAGDQPFFKITFYPKDHRKWALFNFFIFGCTGSSLLLLGLSLVEGSWGYSPLS